MIKYKISHLSEYENVDEKTGCKCIYLEGKGRNTRIHDHEFYEIFVALNPMTHYINGQYEKLERGSCVFVRPADVHGIIFDSDNKNDIINLSFSKEVLNSLVNYISVSYTAAENIKCRHIILDEAETIRVIRSAKKLISDDSDVVKMRILLFGLFSKLLTGNDNENKFPKWFENMCEVMRERENFVEGLPCMERVSGKSREHISRCIKKHLGITASRYINDLRLSYAASQLINSDKKITDICFESGFYSVSWFNKQFYEKYGYSPNEFRKRS